jgi:hypothetical protein
MMIRKLDLPEIAWSPQEEATATVLVMETLRLARARTIQEALTFCTAGFGFDTLQSSTDMLHLSERVGVLGARPVRYEERPMDPALPDSVSPPHRVCDQSTEPSKNQSATCGRPRAAALRA